VSLPELDHVADGVVGAATSGPVMVAGTVEANS
jgi:hypothetical protein